MNIKVSSNESVGGSFPIGQDITVLPADDPSSNTKKIGWVIRESTEPLYLPSDDDSCYETDKADLFLDSWGKHVEMPNHISWTSIDQLEFLWGQPWNNLALKFVKALRPSRLRVTTGNITLDNAPWRVTVVLNEDKRTIKRISQECEVDCTGLVNGYDFQLKFHQQKTGKKIEKFNASCCYVNEYALEKITIGGIKPENS